MIFTSPRKTLLICLTFLLVTQFFSIVLSDDLKVDTHYGQQCSAEDISKCGEPFVCGGNGTCVECADSSQCHGFYSSAYECSPEDFNIEQPDGSIEVRTLNSCQRKDLVPHFNVFDALALIVCSCGGALAASAGIGGGAIYVVALIAIGRYPSTMAAPISTACIFGTAISNLVLLSLRRHPHVKRPLIDFSVALITEPIILAGTIIGVFLNVMFPNWLTLVILVVVLSISAWKSFTKGIKTFKKENAEKRAQNKKHSEQEEVWIDGDANPDEMSDNLDDEYPIPEKSGHVVEQHKLPDDDTPYGDEAGVNSTEDEELGNPFETDLQLVLENKHMEKLEKMKKSESCQFPLVKLGLLAFSWIVVFTSSLLKGAKGNKSIIGIESCRNPWYWVIVAVAFPILISVSMATGVSMRLKHSKKIRWGYEFAPGDIRWTAARSFLLPLLFLFAGILASLLGIGGGILTGPLFLELGLIPQVSMATSSFMIFFTSSATLMQYVFMRSIRLWFAVIYISAGIVSGALGQIIVGFLVKKSGRGSIIIFIIAFTVAIATILQLGLGTYNIVSDIQTGLLSFSKLGFKPPC